MERRDFIKTTALAGAALALDIRPQPGYSLVRRVGNAELFVDSTDSRKRRTVFHARQKWLPTGEVWKDETTPGGLRVMTPNFNVESSATLPDFHIFDGHHNILSKRIVVQKQVGAQWNDVAFTNIGFANRQRTDQNAIWQWRYDSADGFLDCVLSNQNGRRKWGYEFTANTSATFRIAVRYQIKRGGAIRSTYRSFPTFIDPETQEVSPSRWAVFGGVADTPYMAAVNYGQRQRLFYMNWVDLMRSGDFGAVDIQASQIAVTTRPFSMSPTDIAVLDPSFSDDADWGADVDDGGTKFPDSGADWLSVSAGTAYRVANKFTISTLGTEDTVDQVDFQVNVGSITGTPTTSYDIHPYNDNGQADPEADAGSTMYSRCSPAGTPYVDDTTAFNTTGSKSFTDLGSAANSDVEAARDAGTIYSIAIHAEFEGGGTKHPNLDEYTDTDAPTLTVTHTAAGGGGGARGKIIVVQ